MNRLLIAAALCLGLVSVSEAAPAKKDKKKPGADKGPDIALLFNKLDTNNDKKVSPKEFESFNGLMADKAKKAAAEEGGSTRGRAAAASSEEEDEPMFDPKAIAPLKKAEFHALLEAVGAKIEKMRSKDSVDEAKLAYERGKLDGLKLATGLKALPKSLAEE